jgi:radical SAM protein with 4Fe4S-binding SPASM domain
MELQYTPIRAQWPEKDSVITAFRYILACPLVEGKKVLELGCGSGDGAEIIAANAREYTGVDIEKHWNQKYSTQDGNVAFIQADICNLTAEFESKFDVVIAFELVEHLKDPAVLCSQIRKVLSPNGLAMISTPNFDLLSNQGKDSSSPLFKHHIKEYKAGEFEEYLKSFEMEFCIHSLSQLPQGSGISGIRQIVFDDVLHELKVGKEYPDMEILSSKLLPQSMPLHFSQSFFATIGAGVGHKKPFANNFLQKQPAKTDEKISMDAICAMSVEWVLQRRNENISEMQQHTNNLEDIVKDRQEQIDDSLQVITGLQGQLNASQETISIIKNSFSYKTGRFLTIPLRFLYRNAKCLLLENNVAKNYKLKDKLKDLFKPCSNKIKSNGLFEITGKPKVVHLAVSRACNINCIMCPIDRNELKGKKKYLDFETFKKVFGNGKNFGFLNFVGSGEVFVAKDFINIIKYCFDKGFYALGCITNFQLITEELAELMVKNRFQQITISIDGCTKETFEYIRKGAKFHTILKTLDLFCDLKKRYNSDAPNFTFSTVAMNSNIHEFPGMVRLAHKYGVKHINVARLHVSKEEILNESLFFHQEKYNRYYDETIDLCEKLGIEIEMPPKFGLAPAERGQMVRDCRMPFESIYFDVDGVAYPCVCRVDPVVSIGNINENELLDIWQSEIFNRFRIAMFSKSPPKQCEECTFSVLDPNKLESHMAPELAQKVKGGNL